MGRDQWVNTSPAGSFAANSFGLHDMIGNVWEWTEDCWNDSYRNAPADGSAWTAGDCGLRVVRGAAWNYESKGVRSANRSRGGSGLRYINGGFRLARTL